MIERQDQKLTLKQAAWLKHFFRTLNATQAARLAGYRCKNPDSFETIGHQNFVKLQPLIKKWINEIGLTPEKIKLRIIKGMDAKEVQRIKLRGTVRGDDLQEGRRLVAKSGNGDGDSVVEWEEDALGIQAKYVEMAAKVLSLFDGDLLKRVEELEQRFSKGGNR